MNQKTRKIFAKFNITTLVLLLIMGWGCSSSSGPSNGNPGTPRRISVPLEDALADIQLNANQAANIEITLQVPPDIGVIESAEIDVAATLEHVQISASASAVMKGISAMLSGQPASQGFIRVGTDVETVCTEGIAYGPYPADLGFWENPTPETIELDDPTVQILNTGGIILCIELTTTFDATLSVDQVEIDVVESDCDSPADFSGFWTGTFTCGNSCDGTPFGGDIELTITQNGTSATYVDHSGDTYTGTVCGNIFRFERIDQDEIERGSLVLDDATHATKHSTYRGRYEPYCTGDCVDHLTRVESK